MNALRFEIDSILQRKAEFALFCTKQRYYEQGERAEKLLAYRVKQITIQNISPSIFKSQNELLRKRKSTFIKNWTVIFNYRHTPYFLIRSRSIGERDYTKRSYELNKKA